MRNVRTVYVENNNGQVDDDVNEIRNQPEWLLDLVKLCSQCYEKVEAHQRDAFARPDVPGRLHLALEYHDSQYSNCP
jgi:hypothetical protein